MLFLLLFAGGDVFVDGTDVVEIRMQARESGFCKVDTSTRDLAAVGHMDPFAGNCEKYKKVNVVALYR